MNLFEKIKKMPKRQQLLIGLFTLIIVAGIGFFIWAAVTGRIKPFAAIVGQISNTATVTYQNSTGTTRTATSNTVLTDIVTNSPNPVSGLATTATSSSQINLSWIDNSTDETGFKIERATPNCASTFSLITTTAANTTTYQNTGLTASTNYCYQVKATNAGGDSMASNQAQATTQGGTTTINLTITLQGRTNYSTSGTTLKIYPVGGTTPVFTKTDITTDAAGHGTFTITPLAAGNYDFKVKPSYFLTQKIANLSFVNPLTLNYTNGFRGGDLNNDDMINTIDFAQLNGKWGQSDLVADINQDGIVNSIDFALLNFNWFVQGQ